MMIVPTADPRAWIDKILERHKAGDPTLSSYAVELAKDAQQRTNRPEPREREPGEDDG